VHHPAQDPVDKAGANPAAIAEQVVAGIADTPVRVVTRLAQPETEEADTAADSEAVRNTPEAAADTEAATVAAADTEAATVAAADIEAATVAAAAADSEGIEGSPAAGTVIRAAEDIGRAFEEVDTRQEPAGNLVDTNRVGVAAEVGRAVPS